MNSLDSILPKSRQAARWQRVRYLGLAGLALIALARAVQRPDLDALLIALLTSLLIWVLMVNQRQRDLVGRKLDQLLTMQRYGPLSAEDHEVVAALRAADLHQTLRPRG